MRRRAEKNHPTREVVISLSSQRQASAWALPAPWWVVLKDQESQVARKPNYRFDRMERDRSKAAKKAERLKAKQERSTTRNDDSEANEVSPEASGDSEASQDE